jgi:hypothetical protein
LSAGGKHSLRIVELAVDDERDHRTLGLALLEEPDLLVHVVALGRCRRAEDDEGCRGVERGKCLLGERVARGEIVTITEDGLERLRDRPRFRLPADEVIVDAEALEPAMQPFGLRRVGWL